MDRKILLIGLLALTGIGFGADAAYRTYVEEPFKALAAKKVQLEKQKREQRNKLILAKRLVRELPDIQAQSLPADPAAARQRYQAWWWQKVQSHQWQNPSVDIGKPVPIVLDKKKKDQPPVHQFSATIRGIATLQQVTNLLQDFYATPLLQKIESVQMNPIQGGQAVSISLSVSALALSNANEQDQLPTLPNDLMVAQSEVTNPVEQLLNPQVSSKVADADTPPQPTQDNQPQPAGNQPSSNQLLTSSEVPKTSDALPTESVSPEEEAESDGKQPVTTISQSPPPVQGSNSPEKPWQSIVKRNMFQAGGGMQIASKLVLSAITQNAAGQQQAWFRSMDTKRTDILNPGEKLQIGVLSFSFVQAKDDHVIVAIEGSQVRVKIGQTLASGTLVD